MAGVTAEQLARTQTEDEFEELLCTYFEETHASTCDLPFINRHFDYICDVEICDTYDVQHGAPEHSAKMLISYTEFTQTSCCDQVPKKDIEAELRLSVHFLPPYEVRIELIADNRWTPGNEVY